MENQHTMQRAVIYARYSSSSQREESIEGQIRVCTDYANKHGFSITHIYVDRALSGRTDNRPDFQRLLRDSSKNLFDAVIVYKTDRFARNKYDSVIYKSQLKKNKIKICYAAESIPEGPEGIILESLLEGLAEYYSAELAQKIQRGLYENALKCKATGNTPLGYQVSKDHTYEINPKTAPAVKKIFELYIDGKPIKYIIDYLNSIGIRTIKNNSFNKNSLHRILENERYCGIYKYKDVIVEGGMPAIISKETFKAAQAETIRRRRVKRVPSKITNYLLTGKLYCGECKHTMTGTSGTSHTGKTYYYYHCSNKECSYRKKVQRDYIENLVFHETVNYILQPNTISSIAERCVEFLKDNKDSDIDLLKQKLSDNKKAIKNIQKAIEDGGYTKTMTERLRELESEQDNILYELSAEEAKNSIFSKEKIELLLNRFMEPCEDIEKYKRNIINCFISAVYLYEKKMVIIYNVSGPDGGKWENEIDLIDDAASSQLNHADGSSIGSSPPPFVPINEPRILIRKGYFALVVPLIR